MAGWRMTASSMSWNRPVTCGRMASRTKAPATGTHSSRLRLTVKWLLQNQTKRSRNGAGVCVAHASWVRFSAARMLATRVG